MNKIIRLFIMFIFLVNFFCVNSFSILNDIGINPLDSSIGARPKSLGDAYTSVSDDINSIYYNPAAISKNKGFIFSFQDTKNFSMGQAATTSSGAIGLGVVYRSLSNFPYEATTANYESNLVFIGYGFRLRSIANINPILGFFEECHFGLRYKYLLSQRLSPTSSPNMTSSGNTGADAGFLFAPENGWFGCGIKFIGGSSYQLGLTEEASNGSTDFGATFKILGEEGRSIFVNRDFGVLIVTDYSLNSKANNKATSSIGLEFKIFENYSLSVGARQVPKSGADKSYSSFGFGIKLDQSWSLDFSVQQEPVTDSQLSYISILYMPTVFGWQPPKEAEAAPRDFIRITFPPDNYVTYNETVKVQGYTRKNTNVHINGTMAYIGDNLYFTSEVPLNPQKNLVEVKGTLGGREEIILLKVLKKAKVVIAEEEEIDNKIKVELKEKEEKIRQKEAGIERKKKEALGVPEKKRLEEEVRLVAEEKVGVEKEKKELEGKKEKLEERREKVETLVTLGVIEVSQDRNFEIEAKITRGEMVSWLVKAANLPVPELTQNVCLDVPITHQYAPYIKAAIDAGIIKPDKENKVYPDKTVSEQEGQNIFRSFGVIQ